MNSRKVSFEEKMKIVKIVNEGESSCWEVAKEYSIPYQNLHRWVERYNKDGEKALTINRGGKKMVKADRKTCKNCKYKYLEYSDSPCCKCKYCYSSQFKKESQLGSLKDRIIRESGDSLVGKIITIDNIVGIIEEMEQENTN